MYRPVFAPGLRCVRLRPSGADPKSERSRMRSAPSGEPMTADSAGSAARRWRPPARRRVQRGCIRCAGECSFLQRTCCGPRDIGCRVPGQPRGRAARCPAHAARRAWTERGMSVDTSTIFMDCPAYMDEHGAVRCGLPAEVEDQYAVRSSGGPVDSARIRCARGHWFNGPVESLIWGKRTSATVLAGASSQRQDAASLPARKAGPG
jgi:hypothetical protein